MYSDPDLLEVTAFKFKKLTPDEKEMALVLMFGDMIGLQGGGLIPDVRPEMKDFIARLEAPITMCEDDEKLGKEVSALRSLRSGKKREDFMSRPVTPSRRNLSPARRGGMPGRR